MKLGYFKDVILIFFKSVTAAIIAGMTMAVLNVVIDWIIGDSIFKFKQIFHLSLWHALIWLCFGVFIGVVFSILFIIKKNEIFKNFKLIVYFYLYIVCWFLLVGYINMRFLGKFLSAHTIIWNLVFIVAGVSIPSIILKMIGTSETKRFPILLRLYLLILAVVLISSIGLNVSISFHKKNKGISAENKEDTHLNVLIVVLDAVRADHLSCYGYDKNTSPNIDRMAEEGVLFESAFSNSSHTAESVPSLLGSVYPSTHNVRLGMLGTHTTSIPKGLILLPSVFKSNGYKTAFFTLNAPVLSKFGYERNIDDYYEPQKVIIESTVLSHFLNKIFKRGYLGVLLDSSYSLLKSKYNLESTTPEYVTQKVISWLSENQNKPFFLYVHYFGGHAPYNPPEVYRKLFDYDDVTTSVNMHPERYPSMFPFVKQPSLSEPELNKMKALYDGEIYYHDKYLGDLLSHLEKTNLLNNTVVILTSDHGEEFYDHYGWGHIYSLFDELIHVPLIFYCPGFFPEGKRIKELFAHVDLLPTILSLCGISESFNPSYKIEGIDLSSLLLSQNHIKKREYVFSEVNISENLSASCLRSKEYKGIRVKRKQDIKNMFFDLKNDPLAKKNLYDEESSEVIELFDVLETVQKKAISKSFQAEKMQLDEKTKEKLKALGYIK